MPWFKKKQVPERRLSKREISMARLENFRREVITNDHAIALSINAIGSFINFFGIPDSVTIYL